MSNTREKAPREASKLAHRQEEPQKRKYTSPGTDRVAPKFRSGKNWDTAPDYGKLPDFSLVDAAEVSLLTGMAPAVLARRVAAGEFPAPSYHGRNRVWALGTVRRWCEQFGRALEKEGS